MHILLDANAVLRYLLEDDTAKAEAVTQAIMRGAEVTIEVLAECAYVLSGVYNASRSDIAESLGLLLDEAVCARRDVACAALGIYSGSSLDFVDCVLAAEYEVSKREVLTFDKRLCALIADMK